MKVFTMDGFAFVGSWLRACLFVSEGVLPQGHRLPLGMEGWGSGSWNPLLSMTMVWVGLGPRSRLGSVSMLVSRKRCRGWAWVWLCPILSSRCECRCL